MSLIDGISINSADDHVQEPPDLWEKRLPKNLRDRAPRVIVMEDGRGAWSIPGKPPRPFGILVAAGTRRDGGTNLTWDDVPKGSYDPDARIKDMDLDHIQTTFMYPNVCLDFFMNQVKLDADVMGPVCRAYNDHLSEFCVTHRKRLFGIGLVPMDTLDEAIAELKHIAKLPNMKGAMLPVTPPVADWNDLRWDPLWKTAEDLGLIISFHTGKPRGMANRQEMEKQHGGLQIYYQLGRLSMVETFGYLFWSGVFERHPKLRFVSVEGDVGWLPYFKERGEGLMKKHLRWTGFKLEYPPGHWFGTNFFATFEEDRLGVELRHKIGIECMLWASDYPHSATTWPESSKAIEETFAGVPKDEVRQIISTNTAKLYGLN